MSDIDVFNLNDDEIKRLEIIMEESLANPENSIDEEELVREDYNEEGHVNFDLEKVIEPSQSTTQQFTEAFKQFKANKNNIELYTPESSNNYELIDLDKIDKQLDNIINKKTILNNDTLIIKFKRSFTNERHRQLQNNLGSYYYCYSFNVNTNRTHVVTNNELTFPINFELDDFEEFNETKINEIVNNDYCLYKPSVNCIYVPLNITTLKDRINVLTNNYTTYKIYQKHGDHYYFRTNDTINIIDTTYQISNVSSYSIKTLNDCLKNEEFIKNKQSIESILTNLFDDKWYYIENDYNSIELNLYDCITRKNNVYINYLIHFPEINIVNSKDEKHTIKDLYVCLQFDLQHRLIGKMKGFRTSFSAVEIVNYYVHSHLNTRELKGANSNYMSKGEFCVGIGQPIELSITKLNTIYDEEILASLCMQLESYLSWESLEGTPYIKLSSLVKQNNYRPYIHNRHTNLSNYPTRHKEVFDLIKNKCFEYYVVDNKIKIKNIIRNKKSINFLNNNFGKIYVNNNQYYTKNISSGENLENHPHVQRFKRELNQSLNVLNNKHEKITIKSKYIEDENSKEYEQVENLFEIKDFLNHVEYLIN